MTINILSGLMIYKIIVIYHFIEPGGVIIFPLLYCITNIVTEVYGYQISRHLIWCGNLCSVIFLLASYIIIHIPSPKFWHYQSAFDQIFGFMPRVFIAGFLGNTFGLFINTYIVAKLKIILVGKHYWCRCLLATVVGEIGYSIFAAVIMYSGWMSFAKIWQLIIGVIIFKIIYSIFANPIEVILATMLKKKEKINIYDYNTKFTPFKFNLDSGQNRKPIFRVIKPTGDC